MSVCFLKRLGLAAMITLSVSACASSGTGEAAAADAAPAAPGSVQLEIRNNAFGAQDATILLVGGSQQSLGNVPAGQTRTFTVAMEPRSYSLSARTVQGETNSPSFTLFATTSRVSWDMSSNRIQQTSR
jgi:hypothetical protein